MPAQKKYPDELRERGVRLALESGRPISQVARDLGIQRESRAAGSARPRPTPASGPSCSPQTSASG